MTKPPEVILSRPPSSSDEDRRGEPIHNRNLEEDDGQEEEEAHPLPEHDGDTQRIPEDDDDDDDDWSSLLSEGRTDEWYYEDDDYSCSLSESEQDFWAQWDALERQLAARWRSLDKLVDTAEAEGGRGKNPNYVHQMRVREMEAAHVKREELLLQHVAGLSPNRDATADGNSAKAHGNIQGKTPKTATPLEDQNIRTWLQRVSEFVLFERTSTIPAIFTLLLHNVAVICIFDLVDTFVDEAKKLWMSKLNSPSPQQEEQWWVESLFYGVVFATGCTLMRSTGDLFWWLNDREYDCVKFDYHNTIRLRCYHGARIIHAVRHYLVVRCLVYTIGYTLCYLVAQQIFDLGEDLWNQRESLLRYLPSNTFNVDLFQTLDAVQEDEEPDISTTFLCERTCQEEMDRRSDAFEEMLSADQEYTERVLAASSYSAFWEAWVESRAVYMGVDEAPPVFSPAVDLLYYIVFFLFFVGLLRWYGFVFWDRY